MSLCQEPSIHPRFYAILYAKNARCVWFFHVFQKRDGPTLFLNIRCFFLSKVMSLPLLIVLLFKKVRHSPRLRAAAAAASSSNSSNTKSPFSNSRCWTSANSRPRVWPIRGGVLNLQPMSDEKTRRHVHSVGDVDVLAGKAVWFCPERSEQLFVVYWGHVRVLIIYKWAVLRRYLPDKRYTTFVYI